MNDLEKLLQFGPFVLEQDIQEVITQQEVNGWLFDKEAAEKLLSRIEARQSELEKQILPQMDYVKEIKYKVPVNNPFLKDGSYNNRVIAWYPDVEETKLVGGPFSRIEFRHPKLSSHAEVKTELFKLGWRPTEWNYKKDKKGRKVKENGEYLKTSPKLTEDSYESLEGTLGADVKEYLVISHRYNNTNGLVKKVREDGRLTGVGNPIGTPTYRFAHSIIVNIPGNEAILGREMRGLFIAEEGRVIVGHDAASLEARMEAHETFPYDEEYANELVNGDQHMKNAIKWGLVEKYGPKLGRKIAKNGKYALTYGAYPPRIADTLGIPLKEAQKIFDLFWSEDNPLYMLQRKLKWQYDRNGYIRGLDGRVIVPRKEGDLLNYRLQSDGAIVMKRSVIILEEYKRKFNIDAKKVGDFHDEGQNSVLDSQAVLFGNLAVRSIVKAGEYYNLNVPLGADYQIGRSWADTH